jgi:hypothetical protein
MTNAPPAGQLARDLPERLLKRQQGAHRRWFVAS